MMGEKGPIGYQCRDDGTANDRRYQKRILIFGNNPMGQAIER